jgi:23S rRNA (guanosine2251-2'-O)-methyltransferase
MKKLILDELNRASVDEFKSQTKNNFVIVMDNIRSMNNVGSAFRTCDAFAAEKLFLTGITATPPHREINKTAIGAQDAVEWEYADETAELLEQLKKEGYIIVVIEQTDASVPLNEFTPSKEDKYAFVFGNEVMGVDDDALPLADIALEIPQYGTKHSLNVSVCVGVISWDFVSKVTN